MTTSDLHRFVIAQQDTYPVALAELRAGKKRSHWMWFVFPQLRGLGTSANATYYGIASLHEARNYLAHPLLGPRLEEATRCVLQHPDRKLVDILGRPDDMKFRSSMTLFSRADEDGPYRHALSRFCDGKEDEATMMLLGME